MLEELLKIKKLCNNFGIVLDNPSIKENYESRFMIQKVTYICKSMSIPFSYNFGLYHHGPYSHKLAEEYYCYPEYLTFPVENTTLSPLESNFSNKIKENIFQNKLYLDNPLESLEAISTLFYFIAVSNDQTLINLVKTQKPHLSEKLR